MFTGEKTNPTYKGRGGENKKTYILVGSLFIFYFPNR